MSAVPRRGTPTSSPRSLRSDASSPPLVLSKHAALIPAADMSLDTTAGSPERSPPKTGTLFFDSDEEHEHDRTPAASPSNARTRRMQVLRALAKERAPTQDAPVHSDVSEPESAPESDLEQAPAPAPAPRIKALSKREELEMHRVSAQLRREHRATIERAEPKRYHLSELLSTIEHAKKTPSERRLMHSSDPVESSSTPPERRASPRTLMPPNMDPDGAVFVDAPSPSASRQRKARLLQRQLPPADSDDDLVIVPAQSLHARMRAPEPADVSDAQLDASAHTFALASDHAAGMVPTSPVRSASQSPARTHARRHAPAPVIMSMEQFNAALLRKTHEQNAARNAHRTQRVTSSPASDAGSEKENVPLPRRADADADNEEEEEEDGKVFDDDDGKVFDDDDDGDLGRFFVPTQAAPAEDAPAADAPAEDAAAPPQPSAPPATRDSHQSESSVLAQFFESTQDGPPRGASLDLFENRRREGPVGGSMRRLESAVPQDAFAALREREQADAQQLLSPAALPSLDPSAAEHAEDLWRSARNRQSDTLYLNQDGFFTQTKPGASASRAQWLFPSQMDEPAEPAEPAEPEEPTEPEEPAEPEPQEADSDAEDTIEVRPAKPQRRQNAFVYGEAEESEDEEGGGRDGGHGGLGGVFSDHESSEGDENSDDDADLESLLDDERDDDEEAKDELARKRYMQDREEDDAAMQALHERAAKGMLRSRRRGRLDGFGEMLDDDADEEELRRRLRAPRFQRKRRRIDGDGMDELAARDDSQAFVRQYAETHTSADDFSRYEFLAQGESSDEEEPRHATVTAREIREELARQRAKVPEPPEVRSDDEDAPVALHVAAPRAPRAVHDDDDEHARLLFSAHRLDPSALTDEQKARREQLLAEYSHEPEWREMRAGNSALDRRGSGNRARARAAAAAAPAPEARAEPRRLVGSLLRREFA